MHPQVASALVCTDNGLACNVGYFSGQGVTGSQHNLYYGNDGSWGGSPFLLGLRPNNVGDLKFLIGARLSCTNGGNPPTVMTAPGTQNSTGAAFTVLTMLGAPPGTSKHVACQRFWEWASLMDAYDNAGLIHYSEWYAPNGVNTRLSYNQGTDVSYYTDWGPPSAPSVVFYDPNGSGPLYAIKRDCGNPLGRLRPLTWDYDLRPLITATNSAGGNVASGTVEPGDTLTFRYYIRNDGGTASELVNCYGGRLPHAGYFPTPPTPEGGGAPLALGCPRTFGVSSANILVGGPETVTATANTTVCRTLFVNPAVHGGGARGTEVCVPVVSRPYTMTFGGDVKTGGRVETSPDDCSIDTNASIATWNIHNAPAGYYGSGVQYGAVATGVLRAFATAQGSAGSPGMPSGLAFASTTQNLGAGSYGGGFGDAPCVKDYYSQRPATTSTIPANVSSMVTGAYGGSGTITLAGGNVNPAQKIRVYIDGDLFITGTGIRYAGSWSYGNIPMLEVVVRGNIYIANTVTQLDGTYIAQQRTDGSRGYIYTCATSAAPMTLTAGAFYGACATKLTVNGSLVAANMQPLRTIGTLRDGSPGETKASNNAAESFNYGPGFWITQPSLDTSEDGEVDNYDAITSLPPVL
jgi:hypothetical protein